MKKRFEGDSGVTMVILAISMTALFAIIGLTIDGGRAYGSRRDMQNAADAGAMAGTQELNLLLTGASNDARTIRTTALETAEKNGADIDMVTCDLVRFDRTVIEPCPTASTLSAAAQSGAAGVRVNAGDTQETFFMKVVGAKDFTAKANATAQIGRPGGSFEAPFLVCGTAVGHTPPLMIPDPNGVEGFSINPAAVNSSTEYIIYGNDVKNNGRDCGNPSSSFRGNAQDPPGSIPGDWDATTGNKNGPTLRLVNSGNACSGGFFTEGCVMVLPLCPRSNGQPGNNFRVHCTELGLFQVAYVANHDIRAFFKGPATLNQGSIVGPADASGARIVALTD